MLRKKLPRELPKNPELRNGGQLESKCAHPSGLGWTWSEEEQDQDTPEQYRMVEISGKKVDDEFQTSVHHLTRQPIEFGKSEIVLQVRICQGEKVPQPHTLPTEGTKPGRSGAERRWAQAPLMSPKRPSRGPRTRRVTFALREEGLQLSTVAGIDTFRAQGFWQQK